MARAKVESNGHGRLEEALATMLQNTAILVQTQAAFVAQLAKTDRDMAELKQIADARFARIESILLEHSRILADHSRILQALPEAIREKIGFKVPEKPKPAE